MVTDSKWTSWCLRAALLGGALAAVAVLVALALRSDALAFLPRHVGAEWIVFPAPANPSIISAVPTPARFRTQFVLPAAPASATVSVAVNRSGVLLVNGAPLAGLDLAGRDWKRPQTVSVTGALVAGTNQLELIVTNTFGPPAAWVRLAAGALPVASDSSWEVSLAGSAWQPAVLARQPPVLQPGNLLFAPPGSSGRIPLAGVAVVLLLVVGVGFAVDRVAPACRRWWTAPRWWLWPALGLATLWLALAWNNLPQLGRLYGFDVEGHEEYLRYVQTRHALPLANEGWQLYQPPLYYLLGAQFLRLLGLTVEDPAAVAPLRALSLAVGFAHCGVIFLCLRRLFPAGRWQPVLGTLFAAFLPAHLVVSHYVTNENLCAFWVTLSFYFFLRLAVTPGALWLWPACGAALGLALLTKFSAVLVLPALLGALCWLGLTARGLPWRAWLPRAGLLLLTVGFVCGWHYARVWKAFGTPLVGNWDAVSGFSWWQFPGYRTADYYTGFGAAFTAPLFSGVASFADGLYSTFWADGLASGSATMAFNPPWNYDCLQLAALLGLAGTLVLLLGFGRSLRALWRTPRPDSILFLGFTLLLGLGLVYMTLRVASYAQVKSFYALSALLPLCVLFVSGCESLARRGGWLARCGLGAFVAWVALSFAGLWVRSGNPQAGLTQGILQADRGEWAAAVLSFQRASDLPPQLPELPARLAENLLKLGRTSEAVAVARAGADQFPDAPAVRFQLGAALAQLGDTNAAVAEWRTAARLGPQDFRAWQQLALHAWRGGDATGAVAAARSALAVAPYEPTLHALLGINLALVADSAAGVWHLDYACRLKPDFTLAHAHLGRLLLATGAASNALPHLTLAVAANPTDLESLRAQALALQQTGAGADAVAAWRAANQLAPDQPDLLNNLAWLLATAPEASVRGPAEAVTLAQRACELTGRQQPALLGTLAAAFAAAGDFPQAVATADAAIALAERLSQPEVAQRNRELREFYRAGRGVIPPSGP